MWKYWDFYHWRFNKYTQRNTISITLNENSKQKKTKILLG